jgi:hypothetical protein
MKEIMLGKFAPFVDWFVGDGEYANEGSICTRMTSTIASARSSNIGSNSGDSSMDEGTNNIEQENKEEYKVEEEQKGHSEEKANGTGCEDWIVI